MSTSLRIENASTPVTALAFLDLDQLYILAGEGQFLKVFEHQTNKLLSTHKIFKSEHIHGVTCSTIDYGQRPNCASILLWGGRSVCVLECCPGTSAAGVRAGFPITVLETEADDWLLDGCFRPYAGDSWITMLEAVFVTAHNWLLRLRIDIDATSDKIWHQLGGTGAGQRSMLYSAHISWSENGHIVVAAGTTFGEVHLWSFTYDGCWGLVHSQPLYTFTGHQGSVFGVRISENVNLSDGSISRLLASCSDDRTIRVWDISSYQKDEAERHSCRPPVLVPKDRSLATAMGHASRIWSVHFLCLMKEALQLVSFGEDGTAQAWLLEPSPITGQAKGQEGRPFTLVHDHTYGYHSGKNIWATATHENSDGSCFIATGGADGRIVLYSRMGANLIVSGGVSLAQSSIDQAGKAVEDKAVTTETTTDKRAVFDALKGKWDLSRVLRSEIPTYPSGTLTGIANFDQRSSINPAGDAECLYSEEGEFIGENGLCMRATRQYVYRYQSELDKLTAWFVKTEGDGIADYIFHELDFAKSKGYLMGWRMDRPEFTLTARGHHLCIEDNYSAEYKFTFADKKMKELRVKYIVKGPHKNYVADAKYSRPTSEDELAHVDGLTNGIDDKPTQHKKKNSDAFKGYVWVNNKEFVTTTERGIILLGKLDQPPSAGKSDLKAPIVSWEAIGFFEDLRSFSIMSSIPSLGIAFLAAANGQLYQYHSQSNTAHRLGTADRKPAYLKAQETRGDWQRVLGTPYFAESRPRIGLVLTVLGSEIAHVYLYPPDGPIENDSIASAQHRSLLLVQSFVVTSSCLTDKEALIVLGSRNGDLCVYEPSSPEEGSISPCAMLIGAHGNNAITAIKVLPAKETATNPGTSYVFTTGRDGRNAVHSIRKIAWNMFRLETLHESMPPFGPNIEGAHFDPTTNDLFLWGFRSKHFVVWNETQKKEVMNVECGGAHRYWAYTPIDDGKGGGSFVWTKASVCHVFTQTKASHSDLQEGGHGREIKTVAVLPIKDGEECRRQLIATGAEDTAIRIFEYQPRSGFRCLSVLTTHTTGLQHIQWSPDGRYLFSAAGCEELLVWCISSIPNIGIGTVCVSRCSAVTEDKDLRIMDFTILPINHTHTSTNNNKDNPNYLITTIYSDSTLRTFHLQTPSTATSTSTSPTFTPLLQSSYTTHCLTQTTHLHLSPTTTYLCTASTDGHLAFWPLSSALNTHGFRFPSPDTATYEPNSASNHPSTTLSYTHRIPVHSSSIKALLPLPLSPHSTLLITGGDDQALAFTRVSITPPSSPTVSASSSSPTQINTPPTTNTPTHPTLSHATLLLPNAHASAVTGVALLGTDDDDDDDDGERANRRAFRIATVGDDQRIKRWDVSCLVGEVEGVEGVKVKRAGETYSGVGDAAAVEPMGGGRVVVVGIGMEVWCEEGEGEEEEEGKA